jgi:hypothetical protein
MLSRTADHLHGMSLRIERAGQAAQRLAAKPQHRGARQRAAVFSAGVELRHAF